MAQNRKNASKKNNDGVDKTMLYTSVALVIVAFVILIIALVPKNTGGKDGHNTTLTNSASSDVPAASGSTGSESAPPEATDVSTAPDSVAETTSPSVTDDAATTDDATSVDPPVSTGDDETQGGSEPLPSGPISVSLMTEKQDRDGAKITMIYPIVESAGTSTASVDKTNRAIRDYMDERRRIQCVDNVSGEYEYVIEKTDIKYIGETFFSAVIKGHIYSEDASNPTDFAYTVNCDAKTSSILERDSVIFDFAKLRKLFTDSQFKLAEGDAELLDGVSPEDLIREYRPEYDIYPDIYFTGGKVGIAIETVYSLGGYALYEISADKLGDAVYSPD